ncbi:chorismate synthase [Candidatus Riflebacteria bacterium]
MASNSFGQIFRITTWGESHGRAIGVVIDGCPAGLKLSEKDINTELALRAPGRNPFTSPRKEEDLAQVFSGVYEGKTTGTPISIIIFNKDADSSKYEAIKDLLRPGHANLTYLKKYGIFDHRGGGRASARETACRVAAATVAKKILRLEGINIIAFLQAMGKIEASDTMKDLEELRKLTLKSPIFCPDKKAAVVMQKQLLKIKEEGESLGGIVEFRASGLPIGLGDPVYAKLDANLARAMLSLPATKGFELGAGFKAAKMKGSEHNDLFSFKQGKFFTLTNDAGGTLGGISNGMPLVGRVAFKPTSSIKKSMKTVDFGGKKKIFKLPEGSRHDPCVSIRAVPVVEAMCALVLVDALLLNRCAKLFES